MQSDLIQPVSVNEIKIALKSIKGDKAPGPDGFCSSFFQQNWDIVRQDVVDAVLLFLKRVIYLKSGTLQL